MIEVFKTFFGFVKDWRRNGDLSYQLVGCAAGLLTFAAYIGDQRPSEAMAGVMRAVGATGVAGWLESGLPPLLAQPDASTSQILVGLAGLAVVILLVRPFVVSRRDEWPIDLQARGLLGARGACTTWLLLMLAAQFGSVGWVSDWLRSHMIVIIASLVVIPVIGGLLAFAVYQHRRHHATQASADEALRAMSGFGVVVGMTFGALIFVVAGPIISAIDWLFEAESDTCMQAKVSTMQNLARLRQPTGACKLGEHQS